MSPASWDGALRGAADALGLGMWRLDLQSNLASWDAVGAELLDREGPQSAAAFVGWLEAGLGEQSLPDWAHDEEWVSAHLSYRTAEGPRYLQLAGRRSGRLWQGSIQDVTQERMLRQRVVEAERLEAIGRLSAGVSHNFNNMLTIIIACLDDAEGQLVGRQSTDPELVRDIHDAQEAARRASAVVNNMTLLTRSDEEVPREHRHIQPLCSGALEGLRHVAVEGLNILQSIPADLWVWQPPGVLEQVVGNLLANANYALRSVASPTLWLSAQRSESFGVATLELTVSDNGSGVPPEIEPHLFQPFVTSKGNEGTGLGLATASELVSAMGGQLAYRPRQGGGAEFVIVLPLAASSPKPEPLSKQGILSGDLYGRRILIVDDEPIIQRLITRILELAGARVTSAGDLASARAVLRRPYDVVLLDQTLGPEEGLQLLPDLRASKMTRVLVFSGEGIEPSVMPLVDGVVSKPVGAKALVQAIQNVLSTAAK